jgi:GNAT superfamily N-acetyltransferase
MPEITIREGRGEKDVEGVRRLMQEYGEYLGDHPAGAAGICLEGYEQELAELPKGYLVIFLAEVDGFPAGVVALREIARPERACEMKRLWVSGEFRGLRIGRSLIEEALAWAARQGFEAMYLDTVPAAMPEANRMYSSFGFLPIERYNRNSINGIEFFRRSIPKSLIIS